MSLSPNLVAGHPDRQLAAAATAAQATPACGGYIDSSTSPLRYGLHWHRGAGEETNIIMLPKHVPKSCPAEAVCCEAHAERVLVLAACCEA